MPKKSKQLTIHASGYDQLGILEKITEKLIESKVVILDIQQITILGQLSLVFLVEIPNTNFESCTCTLNNIAKQFHISISCSSTKHKITINKPKKYILTIISNNISSSALNAIARTMQKHSINIERINQLGYRPIQCIELLLNFFNKNLNVNTIKEDLFLLATKFCFDLGIQEEYIYRKPKRLVVMDVDSTLIQQEVIDEMAKIYGVENEVKVITQKAMEGKIDFNNSLKTRTKLLAGMPEEKLQLVFSKIKLTPGAKNLIQVLKKNGFKIGIISGGFTYFTKQLKESLQLDFHYANKIEIQNSCFTGEIIGDIINKEKKAEILESISKIENIPLEQIVAVGDGANDIDMLSKAGLGIAYHPKPLLKKQSRAFIKNSNLDCVLYMLGISI